MHPAIAFLKSHDATQGALRVDSRAVKPGDVFVAYPGHSRDGRDFIGAAINSGAKAIICEKSATPQSNGVPTLELEHLSASLGSIAHEYYGEPSSKIAVHGVTGTNGKTTVSTWIAQAYASLGQRCGVIGTIGNGFLDRPDALSDAQNTTPDAANLHHTLRDFYTQGAHAAAMEVSSHALDQGRVSGVQFVSAVFTNLTQDHLDYHGTMDAYGAAKTKLFTDYTVGLRIINADDGLGSTLAARHLPNTITYGIEKGDVRATVTSRSEATMSLHIDSPWGALDCELATTGMFNAYNATAVAATFLCQGKSAQAVSVALSTLKPASGRLEQVRVAVDASAAQTLPTVWIDYAHTPDALEKAIRAVSEAARANVWVVFGCGGDRDRSKRPRMGDIAARLATRVVVTSDNPRSESPGSIINDVLAGIDQSARSRVHVEADRARAIAMAVREAGAEDMVLIAGKGHETYQEISGVRSLFSDVAEAKRALEARVTKEGATHAAR